MHQSAYQVDSRSRWVVLLFTSPSSLVSSQRILFLSSSFVSSSILPFFHSFILSFFHSSVHRRHVRPANIQFFLWIFRWNSSLFSILVYILLLLLLLLLLFPSSILCMINFFRTCWQSEWQPLASNATNRKLQQLKIQRVIFRAGCSSRHSDFFLSFSCLLFVSFSYKVRNNLSIHHAASTAQLLWNSSLHQSEVALWLIRNSAESMISIYMVSPKRRANQRWLVLIS